MDSVLICSRTISGLKWVVEKLICKNINPHIFLRPWFVKIYLYAINSFTCMHWTVKILTHWGLVTHVSYMRQWTCSTWVYIMAWRRIGDKPFAEHTSLLTSYNVRQVATLSELGCLSVVYVWKCIYRAVFVETVVYLCLNVDNKIYDMYFFLLFILWWLVDLAITQLTTS